jgi:hypothetical protein
MACICVLQDLLDAAILFDFANEGQVPAIVAHKDLRCRSPDLSGGAAREEKDDLDQGGQVFGHETVAIATSSTEVVLAQI